MFKAGDKVVCVNPPASGWDCEELTKGGVYTVKSIREDFPDECFFEDCACSWRMSRFELYKPEQEVFQKGDSLRCVDNEGVTDFLNLGEIYECRMANSYYVWVECKPYHGIGFGHRRFEKVERIPAHLEQSPTYEWDEIAGYRIGQQVLDGLTGKLCQQADSVQLPEAFTEREQEEELNEPEYTGASVSYYKIPVDNPISGANPYVAECIDLIEALDLSFAEGNVLKSLVRRAVARKYGTAKKGYDDGLYDAEKMVFFSERVLKKEQQ